MKALAAFGAGLFLAGASLIIIDYTQPPKEETELQKAKTQLTELKKENAKLQALVQTEEKNAPAKPIDSKKKETTNAADSSEEQKALAHPKQVDTSSNTNNKNTYKLHVETGMGSSEITKTLETAGVISDAKNFEAFIIKQNMSNKMQNGTFIIDKTSSYDQLLKILTTPPKN